MKLRRPPSMRESRRYITFRLISELPVSFSELKGAVTNSALNWVGEKGVSLANVKILRNLWDESRQEGWISCTPKSVDDIKMSLALIHQIGDSKVIFRTLRVSGTIKSGKEKVGK
ncbi:MAG: ribonuclease P protein component 2 [Candidatus Aenigmarchaeota archaeon]|nr:ribonuclease P protein component 2 [Candidatus Aenigmarchaeota archaeon]